MPAPVDEPVKLPMAGWYDPRLLVATGIRSAISSLFGHFADKREAIAAANAIQPTPKDGEFDYSGEEAENGFWFDFLADSGDGWRPTFAMARLLAQDRLAKTGLPRGRLLVLGGDQVYPTASLQAYRERFLGPFEEAHAPRGGTPLWSENERPHLYAIPGNHDWYDGLHSFFGLFCRRRVVRPRVDLGISRPGRVIGGRQTQQTRSYFAIELPGGWWLWGTDSQLAGYIDQPQIDYFQHAAAYWMKPGSKLILCVADPVWAYVDPARPEKKFESFSYLERLAGMARMPADRVDRRSDWPQAGAPMDHQLKVVLTGDSHHYCRYVEYDEGAKPQGEEAIPEGEKADPARHYIVCGGGGAFLHPTHHLTDKVFRWRYPKPGVDASAGPCLRAFQIAEDGKAVFPSVSESRALARGNLKFPLLNKLFVATLAGLYGIFNWLLDFHARAAGAESMSALLREGDFLDSIGAYFQLIAMSPWSALFVLASLLGYIQFAESPYSRGLKVAMGAAHALVQAAAVTLTVCAIVHHSGGLLPEASPRADNVVTLFAATVGAAIASGFVFGAYLLFSLNRLGRHPNEAFSSLRIEGSKSFLRMRIDKAGNLAIYPIGLKSVPATDNGPLEELLIEPEIKVPA
jgi:hypothetical protein